MKKIFISLITLLLVFTLTGCNKQEEKKVNTDALKFKEEYESVDNSVTISEKNPIVYSSLDEIKDILNNKTGLIYLGYPECNNCMKIVPILIEASKQAGLKEIYYLNTKEIKEEIISEYDKEEPLIIFVKEGKIIYTYKDSYDDEKEENQLLKKYRKSIHEILGDICDQSC